MFYFNIFPINIIKYNPVMNGNMILMCIAVLYFKRTWEITCKYVLTSDFNHRHDDAHLIKAKHRAKKLFTTGNIS